MTPSQQYEMLLDSLQLMAAPASEQLAVLPDYVCAPDEVVSTFGDAYLLVPQLGWAGLITDDARRCIDAIDAFMATRLPDPALVEPDSLNVHEFWETLRQMAREALSALGHERALPVLRHTTYILGRTSR